MFEAQYLITQDGTNGVSVFSPWFPRQGDQIRYTLDLIQASGASVEVDLFHKNSEDTGDGTTTGSKISFTSSTGRSPAEFTGGLKELVRYKLTGKAASGGTTGYVLLRMLPPVWFDAVKA